MQIAENPTSYRKSKSRNIVVMSDFRPEVEIWPFHACAVKNMQHNPYYRNSSVVLDSLWGRYDVQHNIFLVLFMYCLVVLCLWLEKMWVTPLRTLSSLSLLLRMC